MLKRVMSILLAVCLLAGSIALSEGEATEKKRDFFSSVGGFFEKTWNATVDTAQSAWSEAARTADKAWKDASEAAKKAWSVTAETADRAFGSVEETAKTAWNAASVAVDAALKATSDTVNLMWNAAVDTTVKVLDSAVDYADKAIDATMDFADKAWNQTADSARSAWNATATVARDTWNELVDIADKSWKEVEKTGMNLADLLQISDDDAINALKDAFYITCEALGIDEETAAKIWDEAMAYAKDEKFEKTDMAKNVIAAVLKVKAGLPESDDLAAAVLRFLKNDEKADQGILDQALEHLEEALPVAP